MDAFKGLPADGGKFLR